MSAGGLQLKQHAGQMFGTNSCILCEVWGSWSGVAVNSVLLGCDFSEDRTACVVSVKQSRRVVALDDGVYCTDRHSDFYLRSQF